MKYLIGLAFTFFSLQLSAQKIFATKTGNISFFSSAPLEDIEAINTEVDSKFSPSNGQITFLLLMKAFHFDNSLMEEHFNENYIESDKYPRGEFRGTITNLKDINFSKDGVYPAHVKGLLTMHGITREVQSNGTLEVNKGSVIAKAKFNILLRDFNIGGSLIGKKIAETIAITVNCSYN